MWARYGPTSVEETKKPAMRHHHIRRREESGDWKMGRNQKQRPSLTPNCNTPCALCESKRECPGLTLLLPPSHEHSIPFAIPPLACPGGSNVGAPPPTTNSRRFRTRVLSQPIQAGPPFPRLSGDPTLSRSKNQEKQIEMIDSSYTEIINLIRGNATVDTRLRTSIPTIDLYWRWRSQ